VQTTSPVVQKEKKLFEKLTHESSKSLEKVFEEKPNIAANK
jgi:hypothetical protein